MSGKLRQSPPHPAARHDRRSGRLPASTGSLRGVTKLQIIGGGRMGQALLGGLLSARWAEASDLTVVEVAAEQRAVLAEQFDGVAVVDRPRAGGDVLVAVKPHLVVEVCRQLDRPARVLSIAAGITAAAIEDAIPEQTPVVRAMPNTPSLVGAGAAAVSGGRHAGPDDVAWAVGILSAVGVAVEVPERLLDAVTGLSGSGPAYVFLVAEAMIDAGVSAGLPRDVATTLAMSTIRGAGELLAQPGASPGELRAGVTTPAGTTAAGLRVMEERGVRSAVIEAVHAAADRSRQLGSP